MRYAVFAMLAVALSGLVQAQFDEEGTGAGGFSLADVQQCGISVTDQVYQSAQNTDIWYILRRDFYSRGELDILALNVTACTYLVVPLADFITQTGLASNCRGATLSSAARRLLASPKPMEFTFLADGEFADGWELSYPSRRLTQLPSSPGGTERESASSADLGTTTPGSLPDSPASLDAVAPLSAPTIDASAPAPLLAPRCRESYNDLLADLTLYPSTVDDSLRYFLGTPLITNASLAFCMANVDACSAACLNVGRFWAATSTSIAAMCQAAGLA